MSLVLSEYLSATAPGWEPLSTASLGLRSSASCCVWKCPGCKKQQSTLAYQVEAGSILYCPSKPGETTADRDGKPPSRPDHHCWATRYITNTIKPTPKAIVIAWKQICNNCEMQNLVVHLHILVQFSQLISKYLTESTRIGWHIIAFTIVQICMFLAEPVKAGKDPPTKNQVDQQDQLSFVLGQLQYQLTTQVWTLTQIPTEMYKERRTEKTKHNYGREKHKLTSWWHAVVEWVGREARRGAQVRLNV